MITSYKKFRITGGKAPYTCTITPSTGLSVKYDTSPINEYLDVQITYTDASTEGVLKINVVDANGCLNTITSDVTNPCTPIDGSIRFEGGNSFIVDVADRNQYTYNWFASSGVVIQGSSYTATIQGVAQSLNNQFTVYCILKNAFGCETKLIYNYTACTPEFVDFSVQGQCLQSDVAIDGIVYQANKYTYSNDIDFTANIINSCPNCNIDWKTLNVNTNNSSLKLIYNTILNNGVAVKTGIIKLIAPQGVTQYPLTYTVLDECNNIYSGSFTYRSTSCIATSNCFNIVAQSPIQVKCNDIVTGNAIKYTLTTPILYTAPTGAKQPDWSTFTFIIPTNNGTNIPGYTLVNAGLMNTPLGNVKFNANGTITYSVTTIPSNPGTDIIPWKVCDNTGTCCSNTVLQAFVHACDPNPIANDITVCMQCGSGGYEIDMTAYTDLKNLGLNSYVISNVSNNALSITPDVANQKLILSTGLVQGTITFNYQIKTNNNLTSNVRLVTVTINCAGSNQAVALC